jgi:hypothetical protein
MDHSNQDDTLLAWWLDELDAAEAAVFEEHLFGCDTCAARLRELLTLRNSVRRAVDQGRFATAVTAGFVQRLKDSGRRIREYPLEAGGSVLCTFAPDDDFVVSRLRAPLEGVRQVDLVIEEGGRQHRATHLPFDAASNEVNILQPVAVLRAMGASTQRARLVAVTLGAERVIGEYTFNHRPWK